LSIASAGFSSEATETFEKYTNCESLRTFFSAERGKNFSCRKLPLLHGPNCAVGDLLTS